MKIIKRIYILGMAFIHIAADDFIRHSNSLHDVIDYDTMCDKVTYRELLAGLPRQSYRGLSRITPHKVGERRRMEIDGRMYWVFTRALEPPLFEIPNYLTSKECDDLIRLALQKGLSESRVVTRDTRHNSSSDDIKNIYRVSNNTWLYTSDARRVLLPIKRRLMSFTNLPREIIEGSEPMQVASYKPGGHYHAHLDSTTYPLDYLGNRDHVVKHFPCCHQSTTCNQPRKCCKICRYMTVMYYLSDVEEGGETAFVTASLDRHKKVDYKNGENFNLSYNCSGANVRLRPRKGTAVIWYNHFIDPETGWLGRVDQSSYHGGCDVIKGEKWIANNWINVPPYRDRYVESKYNRRK